MVYKIEKNEGVITFTIDRAEKRNAINDEVMEGFKKVITYIKEHNDVRFLVITGSGEQAFCSGGDLSEFHFLKTEAEAFGMLSKMGNILYDLATLHVPTIALINGAAVGGGCEIATACDFRLVASHAKCGFIQGTLSITSGWGGGTYLFERGLRHDQALKMLIESKKYDAQLLYEMGWAMGVFEGSKEQALEAFIGDMRNIHPDVHRAYKEIELRKWKEKNMYERVMEEIRLCAKLWESDAHNEAVARFLNKTK
ncbi:enoyl-CoA hydratase/isomerase family protein [Ureibacillus sinduriensis]|uniref:Ethylmalonyl-CoA decarboxylase n=1 Tax=Ureibacillus sinduriensis BLB-1 = JCM 15800 TaxID=1384057 RepID=A0A0A3HN72_9BACL|nr:enoyl-CoA hydratase/isomerase family protein [Ureibacillus sinduriensis]KGR73794.1 enoyl-CoA hydratase [Ureibacillus sinduriensis BLB-1 = JCM 15800]